jgi:glycosyltransferase EpsD
VKLLLVAHVDGHIRNFHTSFIKTFTENGYEVDVASNGEYKFESTYQKFNVKFARSPLKLSNIHAFLFIRKILKIQHYDVVYCNTPIAGAITRLASISSRKKGTKVIYSAHGFNFYKGEKALKNLIFITLEKILSVLTDCIITMNYEDYQNCINYKFKSPHIVNVNGVGINKSKYLPANEDEKSEIRGKNGYSINDFLLIYPAELSKRKNQELLFDIVNELKNTIPNLKLLLVGKGELEELYKEKIKSMVLEDYIELLGFRNDIPELLKMSDVLIASSLTEGLPINLIEAMSTGLPIVATNVRGHVDLIENNKNGFLFSPNNINEVVDKLNRLYKDKKIYNSISEINIKKSEMYDFNKVKYEYLDILEKLKRGCSN